MSRSEVKASGETPRSTFRFPLTALNQLDSLVIAFEAETGRQENRTSVLLQLIHREAVKREKKEAKK